MSSVLRRLQGTNLLGTLGWALGSALVSQLLNVGNSILLGRILKAELFGAYNLLLMTVAVACSVGSFGMGVTATRFVANERGHGGQKLRSLIRFIVQFTLLASLATSALFLALSGVLTEALLQDPTLAGPYRIASLYVVGFSMDLVLIGVLMGFEKFRVLALTGAVKGVFAVVACSLLARSSALPGAVLGISVMTLLGAALNGWFVARTVAQLPEERQVLSRAERRHLLRFSLPIMLASLLVNPSVWLSSLMVSREASGNRLLAEFAVVRNWLIILQFFPLQIAQALLPFLSRRAAVTHHRSLLPLAVVTAVAAGLAVLSYPVGLWFVDLYGFGSASLHTGFTLIVLASVVSAINTMAGQILLSEGRSMPRLVVDVMVSLTLLLTVYLFVHAVGRPDLALAAGTAISLAVGAAGVTLTQFLLRRPGDPAPSPAPAGASPVTETTTETGQPFQ